MTEFYGWVIVVELAIMIVILCVGIARMGKPKQIEMEITKVGDGFIHGIDRRGRQYAVGVDRITTENCYPKVGNVVTFR